MIPEQIEWIKDKVWINGMFSFLYTFSESCVISFDMTNLLWIMGVKFMHEFFTEIYLNSSGKIKIDAELLIYW